MRKTRKKRFSDLRHFPTRDDSEALAPRASIPLEKIFREVKHGRDAVSEGFFESRGKHVVWKILFQYKPKLTAV